jgi:hypothetical protein
MIEQPAKLDEHTQRVIRGILIEGLPIAQRIANYVTRVALLASMEDWGDQDKVVSAARDACAAYRAGFLHGLCGVGPRGEAEWFRVGMADGASALAGQVDRVAHDSRFVARTGTEEASPEVVDELRRLLRGHLADIDRALEDVADKEIKSLYVRLWREAAAEDDQAEGRLRARLGLSVAGVVDTLPLGPSRR